MSLVFTRSARNSRGERASRIYFALAGLMALLAGCVSQRPVGAVHALATPHAFRLSLERSAARPGEIVMAKMRFENTGTGDLWVPPRSQLAFGWSATNDPTRDAVVHLAPSACNGINYRRVAQNKSLEYEMGFVVPNVSGRIYVFLDEEQQITVPLDVQ